MTLERHRSHLIPDVSYSLDGTLFVTDTGGTFPLRGKGKNHKDVRKHAFSDTPPPPPSYLSYDPKREEKKRRYKQRPSPSRFGAEVQNASGFSTISTNTSSLGRRLRRSKRKYSSVRGHEYRYGGNNNRGEKDFRFKENGYSSVSGGSTGRRLRGGTPRMTPEFADTLKRKRVSRSMDFADFNSDGTYNKTKRRSSSDRRHSVASIKSLQVKTRLRKIHDEKLPYLPFIINGSILIILGIIRVLISYWHVYYSALWAGLLSLCLGIIGARHRGLYLNKNLNAAYILFGILATAGQLAAAGFVVHVVVPTVTLLADNKLPSEVIEAVTYTRMNSTVISSLSPSNVVWANLGLDLATLIFIFVGLFAMTATIIALSNHWDATYDTTADCDHRGNPRLFNPIEQISLGEATIVIALVHLGADAGLVMTVSQSHYYLPLIAGVLVLLSGMLSFCFGKRTDVLSLGTFACIFEFLSFLACCGATVVIVLGIVDNALLLQRESTGLVRKEQLAVTVIGGILVLVLAINVVFIVGTVFRQFRQVCCKDCCTEREEEDVIEDSYGTMNRRR